MSGTFSLIENNQSLVVVPGKVSQKISLAKYDSKGDSGHLKIAASSWYHAGFLEGFMTHELIKESINLFKQTYNDICKVLGTVNDSDFDFFFVQQENWIKSNFKNNSDPFWDGFKLVIDHINGLVDGYNHYDQIQKKNFSNIRISDFLFLNSFSDLYLIESYLKNSSENLLHVPKNTFYNEAETLKELIIKRLLTGHIGVSFFKHDNFNNLDWFHSFWTLLPSHLKIYKAYSIQNSIPTRKSIISFIAYPGQVSTESFNVIKSINLTSAFIKIPYLASQLPKITVPLHQIKLGWMILSHANYVSNTSFEWIENISKFNQSIPLGWKFIISYKNSSEWNLRIFEHALNSNLMYVVIIKIDKFTIF